MLGQNHLLTSVAGWCALGAPSLALAGYPVDAATIAAGGAVCAGASMLPDLDHPSATVARSLGPVTQTLSNLVSKVAGGHRMGTHSFLGVAVFAVMVFLLLSSLGIWAQVGVAIFTSALATRVLTDARGVPCLAMACLLGVGVIALDPDPAWMPVALLLGYSFHILGDMLTPEGAPLLYPVPTRFKVPIIGTTGDFREKIIAGICGLWAVYALAVGVFLPGIQGEATAFGQGSAASTIANPLEKVGDAFSGFVASMRTEGDS